jgi:MFS family permease
MIKEQVSRTFRSLKHRNFRIYVAGQFLSLCGTWMQNLAVSWLVYRTTKSAWMVGLVSFCSLTPTLVLGLVGGHLADHVNRKKIILTAQAVGMLQSLLLSYLVFSNNVQIWAVLALIAVMGVTNAFDIPARQSMIANLVAREDLVNAVSLNASMFNGARLIGPAIAGLIITYCGEGVCFAANTVSYVAVIVAISLMQFDTRVDSQLKSNGNTSITEGVKFVWSTPAVRNALLLVMVLSMFGMQFLMLMPVFAAEVLHGKASLLGALSASAGAGSLAASLILANRATGDRLQRAVGVALLAFSVALTAFSLSDRIWLSLPLVSLVAFCMTYQLSGCQSLIQLAAPDRVRGKVMSVYMMTFMGMGPAGNLLSGWLARQIGTPKTLSLCASVCCLAALTYLFLIARSDRVGACPAKES